MKGREPFCTLRGQAFSRILLFILQVFAFSSGSAARVKTSKHPVNLATNSAMKSDPSLPDDSFHDDDYSYDDDDDDFDESFELLGKGGESSRGGGGRSRGESPSNGGSIIATAHHPHRPVPQRRTSSWRPWRSWRDTSWDACCCHHPAVRGRSE